VSDLEILRGALVAAVEAMEEMVEYAPVYFREKHGLDEQIARARLALSVIPGPVEAPVPAVSVYADRLAALAALEEDWNSYGAPPVDRDVLDVVGGFLGAIEHGEAALVPLSTGGIRVEVHRDGWDMELVLDSHAGDSGDVCWTFTEALSGPPLPSRRRAERIFDIIVETRASIPTPAEVEAAARAILFGERYPSIAMKEPDGAQWSGALLVALLLAIAWPAVAVVACSGAGW
jgi:hypothetical protein